MFKRTRIGRSRYYDHTQSDGEDDNLCFTGGKANACGVRKGEAAALAKRLKAGWRGELPK